MPPVALGIPVLRRDPADAPSTAGRPDTADLVDRFGRVARDLRISITSACSLRCTYCMPADGLPVIPARDLLSADEIGRLVGIAVHDLGVREVRRIENEELFLKPVSRTFHGRDIFAPVAAYLAAGGSPRQVGASMPEMQSLDVPPPRAEEGAVRGTIVHVDHFGNMIA